ncbi:MAG: BolA family transcriptional regulator [Gammaproteobacteria bacterium]|nr:BolA family transcriptional regulator [Gammaproteobacteria bacterium]
MSSAADRSTKILTALRQAFPTAELALSDESHLHRGHAGAREGKGHFRLSITTPEFAGLAPLARHRRVFAALEALMASDIHALSIDARAPVVPDA